MSDTENLINEEQLPQKPQNKREAIHTVFEYLETFCYALVLMVILFLFVFRYVTVDGESMRDTLQDQDKLVISNLFYTPKTGDVVVIARENNDEPLIKRVIATEGQTVRINNTTWEVFVDGVLIDEPYVRHIIDGVDIKDTRPMTNRFFGDDNIFEYTVKEDCVFVMGDNRTNSNDSRYEEYRDLPVSNILGRLLFRVFPINKFGAV